MTIKKTGGKWNPDGWPIYFAAYTTAWPERLADLLSYVLIAANELNSPKLEDLLRNIARARPVLMDSGVYSMVTAYAKEHDVSMDVALSTAPERIEGFQELFDRYVRLATELKDTLWGFVEIDFGGKENKIKTRAKIEAHGIVPIPVYHPLNDGWEYFDYLAQRYDRICLGNIVNAEEEVRKRLVATVWERRRKYPKLWIHGLGLSPGALTTAFPLNSCDSSSWASPLRWGQHNVRIATVAADALGLQFVYEYGDPKGKRGWDKCQAMCAYDSVILSRQMGVIADEQEAELGCDIGGFK